MISRLKKTDDIHEITEFGLKPLEMLASELEEELADPRHDEKLYIKAGMVLDYARSLKQRALELASNK